MHAKEASPVTSVAPRAASRELSIVIMAHAVRSAPVAARPSCDVILDICLAKHMPEFLRGTAYNNPQGASQVTSNAVQTRLLLVMRVR